MKNLIKSATNTKKQELELFIQKINQLATIDEITNNWHYKELMSKSKSFNGMNLNECRAYLIKRKEKKVYRDIENEANKIKTIFEAGKIVDIKISIEWKKSATWGANPHGEAWLSFIDKDGHRNSKYVTFGGVSGCGYDKLSTAVAGCLNQFSEVLKPLYTIKNKNIDTPNRDLFGYGSGYGLLPYFEGGVGVSCYPTIFDKIGFKFNSVASGKSFDVFTITKK